MAFVPCSRMARQRTNAAAVVWAADPTLRRASTVSSRSRQLRALRLLDEALREWPRVGRLHRSHRGVYAVGHRRLTWHGRCWAAVLGAKPMRWTRWFGRRWPAMVRLLICGGSIAYAPEPIDVTAPIRRRAKRAFVVHFSSILAPEDRGERERDPGHFGRLGRCSISRSALTPERLERLLERAEETRALRPPRVEDVLDRAGGHRGRGRLRRALALYQPDPAFTRSASRSASAGSSAAPDSPPPR